MKTTHQPPDNLEEYKKEFGSVGVQLHAAVSKARVTSTAQSSSNQAVTQTSKILSRKYIGLYFVLFFCSVGTQSKTAVGRPVAVATTTATATTSSLATPQKYVLMSQRSTVSQVFFFFIYNLIEYLLSPVFYYFLERTE